MSIEWIIPTMKQAYKNREVAFSVWNNLLKKLLGPKSKIAFVGPEGVGKSVLLDHITGRAAETNYTPQVNLARQSMVKQGTQKIVLHLWYHQDKEGQR